ncbi:MAG: DUF2178 domain-containing protein [Planctomycetota bacterium]
MSHRERNAWISLLATLVIGGAWVWRISTATRGALAEPGELIGLLIGAVVLAVILAIALGILTAIVTRRSEKPAPADERERLIEMKATRLSYGMVLALVMTLAFAADVGLESSLLAHGIFGCVLAGELLRHGLQLWHYRRGVGV